MIKHGANVSLADAEGSSPLHKAAFSGIAPTPELYLVKLTIHTGKSDCVTRLLQGGADVECQDGEDGTPLHNAAFNGHVECVKVLLGAQANLNR